MIKVGDKVIFKKGSIVPTSNLLMVVISTSGFGPFKKCNIMGYNDNTRITFVDGVKVNRLLKLNFDDAFSIIHDENTVENVREKLMKRKDDYND